MYIYRTSYGTEANVISNDYVWDLSYRQFITTDYIMWTEKLRKASRRDFPEYYRDNGRDETPERGIKFDRTGKLKPRKI